MAAEHIPVTILAIAATLLALTTGWRCLRVLFSDWKADTPVVYSWLTLCLCVAVAVFSLVAIGTTGLI